MGSGIIEIKHSQHAIQSILFADDGKQVVTAGEEGVLRWWQVDDGRQVDQPIQTKGSENIAAALSPDRKWLVCSLLSRSNLGFKLGLTTFVRVWDARTHKKAFEVKGHTNTVFSIAISPDSTKFATGGSEIPSVVFIWSMTTGKRLVGPLEHSDWVIALQFSPDGDRIATATATLSIRIYKSDDGQKLLAIPFPIPQHMSSLAWSADGRHIFAVSSDGAGYFDTSSGTLLGKWFTHGIRKGDHASIALARNQKFVVISAHNTLSFWDAYTHEQIGAVIQNAGPIRALALSPNDDCVATGEATGKVTIRSLSYDILPASYLAVNQLPLLHIGDAALDLWKHGDWIRLEELFAEEIAHPLNSTHHARALAHRALVRTRSKQWDIAIHDAKMSVQMQRTTVGHIANAIAHVGTGDYESALRVFDLVFVDGLTHENNILLLIRAIILFVCGKRNNAILRVNDLINIVGNQSLYVTVQAQMHLLLGGMALREGDNDRAMELLGQAREVAPFQKTPHLEVITLIFGWDFDRLDLAIQQHLRECTKPFEGHDSAATQPKSPETIIPYSDALSANPSDPVGHLVERSKAWAMLGSWEDALKSADEAVKVDPRSPWGYERRHEALHGLQRYDEALEAFSRMLSIIEESPDSDTRQLGNKYVSPAQSETTIDNVVRAVSKVSPLVLIDVKSGRLCDEPARMHIFKSEPQFKALVSSMTKTLDSEHIQRVVETFFRYVTLSHVWEGDEPSFQDVSLAGSVWQLDSSALDKKLRKFCEKVRRGGYRWAWSDTCCIDKTVSTVLNQSLTRMYKWYEASAATFILLVDVESPSVPGALTKSVWMTRAWTTQELLAGKVIRFYDRNWKPYLGETRLNHKESSEIMQELAGALSISRATITAFNPDALSVQEKLRLASTRHAKFEEDVAYSLIGIFKSDIRPHYGEGDVALGHLLEEIVARSGEVTVLAWTGKPSSYNSCLPASLVVYACTPSTSPAIGGSEMDMRVAALRPSTPEGEATQFYAQVTSLLPARFANRRLYLPSIVFTIKKLTVQDFGNDHETHYRARVSGVGDVEFRTSDRLSLAEPRRIILVHPWIRELRDPLDRLAWGSTMDEDDVKAEVSSVSDAPEPLRPNGPPAAATITNDYMRALRLVVRLQQPFHALLLQQQPNGEFKRVATEHEIIVPGVERAISFARDVRTEVIEIL